MKVHGFVGFKEAERVVLTLADITLELRYTALEKAAEENSAPPPIRAKYYFAHE